MDGSTGEDIRALAGAIRKLVKDEWGNLTYEEVVDSIYMDPLTPEEKTALLRIEHIG